MSTNKPPSGYERAVESLVNACMRDMSTFDPTDPTGELNIEIDAKLRRYYLTQALELCELAQKVGMPPTLLEEVEDGLDFDAAIAEIVEQSVSLQEPYSVQ